MQWFCQFVECLTRQERHSWCSRHPHEGTYLSSPKGSQQMLHSAEELS